MVSPDGCPCEGHSTSLAVRTIHVNAGVAALAAVLVLGKRKGWPTEGHPPHSMPLVMIGTAILFFGWFGFNSGAGGLTNGVAVQAFANTFLAAAAGGLAWSLTERIKDGHFTNLGAASGLVAGLVAITPAAGFVSDMSSIWIGAAAGIICALAVGLKFKAGYDDSLDVVGVHMVGGLVGSMLIGFFAKPGALGDFKAGLLYGGGGELLLEQFIANAVTIVFSFVVTFVILKALDMVMGIPGQRGGRGHRARHLTACRVRIQPRRIDDGPLIRPVKTTWCRCSRS
ncbi:MAG: hypothetical protein M5U19_16655 [Microthrixaceae bacterium]|nr:hypothetical protein [Microthrixaceae bacterium]